MKRDSVVVYRSTRDLLKQIREESEEHYNMAVDILFDYGLDGIVPDENELPLLIKMFWVSLKPLIDSNNKRFKNGKKGGAPAGNQNAKQPKNNQKTTKKQPTVEKKQPMYLDEDVNEDVNANDNNHEDVNVHEDVHEDVNVKNTPLTPQGGNSPNGETEIFLDPAEGWEDP